MAQMVPQTRGNGALDLFNIQQVRVLLSPSYAPSRSLALVHTHTSPMQARFFNRTLLVELGAHRPLSQMSEMSRAEWATTHRWAQSTRPRSESGVRLAARSRPATREEWMAVPRGTPQAPSPIGAAFPQVPHRGDSVAWRADAQRHTETYRDTGAQPERPDTASSHRQVVRRREKYEHPEAFPRSLQERLRRVRAEEVAERQRLQDELRSANRCFADRRLVQKMGVAGLRLDGRRTQTAGMQRGWID